MALTPIPVKNVTKTLIYGFILRNESTKILANSLTNKGNVSQPNNSAVGDQDFYSITAPTIVANVANNISFVICPTGRMLVIHELEIQTTADCVVQFYIHRRLQNSIGAAADAGVILLDGMTESYRKLITNATGGSAKVEFVDQPLVLYPGDRVQIAYWRNNTVGVNWVFNIKGLSLTSDTNYESDYTMLVLGDSIGGITSDAGSLTTGLWPEIIKNKYISVKNKNIRLVNICQGGTNTNIWDWWVKQGRIDNIKADILFINLGMNDAVSTYGLSVNNGFTKIGFKNIVAKYLQINPKGKVVINSITATDVSPNVTNVPAYRIEIANAVNEMSSSGLPVFFSDTATAYNASTGVPFVSTEQATGSRLHPNTTIGQPAMAEKIWDVCKNLLD